MPPKCALLAQNQVDFGVTGDRDWLGLVLNAFMPADDVVLAVGNIFDLEVPSAVRCWILRWQYYNDVAGHLSVYVAQQRSDAGLIELEGTLVALRPCA